MCVLLPGVGEWGDGHFINELPLDLIMASIRTTFLLMYICLYLILVA